MNTLIFSMFIGVIIGIIDIIPMIVKKLPKYAITSSFLFFFFISIIIFYTNLPFLAWWLQGSVISVAMMLPVLLHVAVFDKKAIPFIILNAVVLGAIVSVVKFYW